MNSHDAIITFNAGSSSLKFGLYTGRDEALACMLHGSIRDLGEAAVFEHSTGKEAQRLPQLENHEQALAWLMDWLSGWLRQHHPETRIIAAGHRVVHGGSDFTAPVRIDPRVLSRLHALVHLAPLHMPHNLALVEAVQQQLPALPQVACFDTAFHHTMPWNEQHYALPHEWFDKGVRRYGFHGLSYEYIAAMLPEYLGKWANARVIVAHLGHGASLCAMRNRQSLATTMGFTPLDGLPMATRPGSIDPGITGWLQREAGMGPDDIDSMLNYQSGLLALSGSSDDMRVLLADKSDAARRAVDYFVHHTHRALASLVAVLGGLDALVFTAGIGEKSAAIRQKICEQASWLGLEISPASNAENNIKISTPGSRASIWCIPTNEEIVIARHTRDLLAQ
ncbi:MAG TPA: acetate/propionate family kinase [Gammaproteobacteria bacterium]|nr:acetate/propionate family kinase [Gammaproteobacteria bacterium]